MACLLMSLLGTVGWVLLPTTFPPKEAHNTHSTVWCHTNGVFWSSVPLPSSLFSVSPLPLPFPLHFPSSHSIMFPQKFSGNSRSQMDFSSLRIPRDNPKTTPLHLKRRACQGTRDRNKHGGQGRTANHPSNISLAHSTDGLASMMVDGSHGNHTCAMTSGPWPLELYQRLRAVLTAAAFANASERQRKLQWSSTQCAISALQSPKSTKTNNFFTTILQISRHDRKLTPLSAFTKQRIIMSDSVGLKPSHDEDTKVKERCVGEPKSSVGHEENEMKPGQKQGSQMSLFLSRKLPAYEFECRLQPKKPQCINGV